MSFKRKRNVKLDITGTYSVFPLNTFNENEIEDYEEIKATGMEEDEEKELHLQEVIKENKKSIPLPVIVQIDNKCKTHYKPKKIEKFINWQQDVPNKYLLSKEETEELKNIEEKSRNIIQNGAIVLVNSNNIKLLYEHDTLRAVLLNTPILENINTLDFDKAIECFGKDQKHFSAIKNLKFVDFVLRRCLIHFEKFNYEAYCVFKPRIVQPKIKSRKNEQNTVEKLEKMYKEFKAIDKSCDLVNRQIELEKKLFQQTINVIETHGDIFNSRIRKRLEFKKKKQDINELFFERKKKLKTTNILPLNQVIVDKCVEAIKTINIEDNKQIKQEKTNFVPKTYENRFDCELK